MKFYNLFLLGLIVFQSVDAFNVKVLLAKIPKEQLEKSPVVLKSTTGFFINESGQKQQNCANKEIQFVVKNNELLVNGNKITTGGLLVSSQLTLKQNKEIVALAKQWILDIKKDVQDDFKKLESFCNDLVVKKDHKKALDGQNLEIFFLHWLDQFCAYATQNKDAAEDLQKSLQLSSKKCVYASAKNLFVKKISESKLSKDDYYKLGNSENFRRTFFLKIVVDCLHDLATEFLLALPYYEIKRVVSESLHGIEYNGGVFWGDLYFLKDQENYLIINSLDIDDYLISVLNAESWPGWPLEAYKTLVIASRSYLVSKVLEAVRCKRLFHIKNTIAHQSYNGYSKVHKNILKAARETRDTIMVFKGKVVEAMFDACCGGVIPAKISDFAFEKVPYLARTKVCTHCKPCWIYSWKSSFTESQLLEKLQKALPDLKKIREMKVVLRDEAKLVKKVQIFDGKKRYYLTGKKMYSLFSEIKSFCFDIRKRNRQFVIDGRGYGHHMGLCQWGARKMVDAHWSHQAILKFYYPGIELMQLSYL